MPEQRPGLTFETACVQLAVQHVITDTPAWRAVRTLGLYKLGTPLREKSEGRFDLRLG